MPIERSASNGAADLPMLLAALFLLLMLVGFVHACGSEDLVFPGEFPFTVTAGNTATPEPTEDDEEI